MNDAQINTIKTAVEILRNTPHNHPKRAIRIKTADQMELQYLGLGNPFYDADVAKLAQAIINANKPKEALDYDLDEQIPEAATLNDLTPEQQRDWFSDIEPVEF